MAVSLEAWQGRNPRGPRKGKSARSSEADVPRLQDDAGSTIRSRSGGWRWASSPPIAVGAVVGLLTSDGSVFWLRAVDTRRRDVGNSRVHDRAGAPGGEGGYSARSRASLARSAPCSRVAPARLDRQRDARSMSTENAGCGLSSRRPGRSRADRRGPTRARSRCSRRSADGSTRSSPNVPVNLLYVGPDPDSVPLHQTCPQGRRKYKSVLTKAEVSRSTTGIKSSLNGRTPCPSRRASIRRNRVPAPR